jgi:hypothetical protein
VSTAVTAIRSTIPVGGVEIVFGINAEGTSLESVTKPLTSTDQEPEATPEPDPA